MIAELPKEEILRQREFAAMVRELLAVRTQGASAFVQTFGCQGNEADSERLRGMLELCGFARAETMETADLILFNTCAVREHAQDRVFGNVGAVKSLKERNRKIHIGVCGCMAQQKHVAEKFRQNYPFVDLVFGTHALHRLPELLYQLYTAQKRVFALDETAAIAEDIPLRRSSDFRAWLPIMYGCNNFCSYCVVPLVRGSERSRSPARVLAEAKELVAAGYKEITLLGQNVNSYRAADAAGETVDFPKLLRAIDDIEGDFWLRFMTSHPKDCSEDLLQVMARGKHIAMHLHLPAQSGDDGILKRMNRVYTSGEYLRVANRAKELMPALSVTSDIIVGFPGESYDNFKNTLRLAEQVRYTSLFTFIYSPREGTRAAALPDPVPHAEKVKWLQELTALQERVSAEQCDAMRNRTLRVLCEDDGKKMRWSGRTQGNQIVEFDGAAQIGHFCVVKITNVIKSRFYGEMI
ncbi:MAG: tRNA (N6-isopentenyl adenosine(37)-C2)-methylthiotransferase MiaB [Oscillospiraceae bacterium]|jgi:tRNA-2-methylthio-N6-dimethylallyladenosine synthase|nr:tRNA (N6-isopentenyl adenosine(37)-C2)-methylthiotransferase MiaB [Oscillospiraceae bacterium]